ncbi:MAG: type VI secretion system baseplate subunit TssG, partial [Planctomycetota bacterium]
MTTSSTHESPPTSEDRRRRAVFESLANRPHEFDFFQAVRLLTQIGCRESDGTPPRRQVVGRDFSPQHEVVRFRALPSHSFPPAEIASFHVTDQSAPAEMSVSFMGLTGPVGALPQHYTQAVIDRLRLKDHALREFLDLFNHRAISFFYRAWEKHRVLPSMERACVEGVEDPFTRSVYCCVGMGVSTLRDRLEARDETFLYYAGLFAHYPRNAVS